jgi:hypothetical protein
MAYGTHPAEVQTHDIGVHIVTWTMTILGFIAAAIGTWFAAASEGTMTLFDRTYERSDLADTWAPVLLILGGAAALIGMVTSAFRDYEHGENRWLVALEILLALVGVAAVVFGIVLMF